METKPEDYIWSHIRIQSYTQTSWLAKTCMNTLDPSTEKKLHQNHGSATELAPTSLPLWGHKDSLQFPPQKFLNIDYRALGNPGQINGRAWTCSQQEGDALQSSKQQNVSKDKKVCQKTQNRADLHGGTRFTNGRAFCPPLFLHVSSQVQRPLTTLNSHPHPLFLLITCENRMLLN